MSRDQELLSELLILSSAIRRTLQEETVRPFKADGVNDVRISLLQLLARRGKQSVSVLARFLDLSKAAASQNVERLVRLGYVERTADTQDRRTIWVQMTAKGKSLLKTVEQQQLRTFRSFYKRLSPQLKALVEAPLGELSSALFSLAGTDGKECCGCCAFAEARCVWDNADEDWVCAFASEAVPDCR